MNRWKTSWVAALIVLVLAIAGCQDSGESNEDLMDPGTMPVMTDDAGTSQ